MVPSSDRARLWYLSDVNPRFKTAVLICLVAMLSYLSARLGSLLVIGPGMISALWPGNVLLVSVLLVVERRRWPVLIATAMVACILLDLQIGVPIHSIALLTLTDVVEVLVATLFLTHFFDAVPELNSVKALAKYSLFAVVIAPFAGALLGALATSGNYWTDWRIAFFSEALGFLILTPLILSSFSKITAWKPKSPAYYFESSLLLIAIFLFGYFAFSTSRGNSSPAMLYSIVPFLLWAALRFGSTGTSAATTIVAFLSIWGAVHGRGPFINLGPIRSVLSLQLFLFCTAAPFMVLAAVVEERKSAERTLRKSEEKFSKVFSGSPLALAITRAVDDRYLDVNETFVRMTGFSRKEAIGQTPFALGLWLNPTPREGLKKSLQQEGSLRNIEGPYRTKDGAIRIALTTAELIEIGDETCVLTVTADITERKRAEVQFELAFESAPHGMMILDQQGIITLINSKTEKLFGYGRCDLLGQSIERIVPEVFQMNSSAFGKDTDLKGVEPSKMLLARRQNGTSFFVEIGLNLMDTQDGTRILASIVDMTEHEQAEEVRFRHTAIVESTDDAIISRNLDGVIQTWNAGAQRIFGYTAAEAVGQPITIIVPHELEDEENEMLELSKAGIRVGHFETVRVSKEGRKVQVSLTISPLRDFSGRIAGSSKIARDITERKQAEQTLRESEERFRLVANSAPVLIWMSGTDGLCSFFNERWLNFRGRTANEESGEGWISGVHPDDREHCLRIYLGAFEARVAFQMEYRLRRFDGVYRWIVDYGVPRFESNGTFIGYIGSGLDITERRLSEEALLDMSGRLIAAHEEERARIARELHDDLSQRMALLEIGIEQLTQETPGIQLAAKELLDNIAQAANEISSDIHNLSHELHPSKLDALGLVAAVGGFCREFSKQHDLQIRFVHHDIPSRISKDLTLCLFRIVQEALRNVVKYSGTASAQVELIVQQDLIHLCISDSGAGFDPESAKGKSGLGLVSMRERLRLVGGHLVVESKPSHGTRIRVYAPLAASQGNFTTNETSLAAQAKS